MKFFWRYVWNKMKQIGNEPQDPDCPSTIASAKLSRDCDIDSDNGLNITVRKAIGGRIVTFRHYDHKTDRSIIKLYVIHDELNFEQELGKMITLESLR